MVAGSGVMGRAILNMFHEAGFDCSLLTRDSTRHAWLPPGVRAFDMTDLPEEAPDLVIESIPEDLELKRAFFDDLDRHYRGHAILASNTSSLPLLEIASELRYPGSFCGLHYFHPPKAFRYVELIQVTTEPEVVQQVAEAVVRTGKEAIVLRKPVPGGLLNRLQHAICHEAGYLLDQGVTDVETIDLIIKNSLGPRMAVTGLLQQKDITGLDIFIAVQRSIVPNLYHGSEATRFFQGTVQAGHLGIKTGRGFYEWDGIDIDAYLRRNAEKLARILAIVAEG
jgi:3-hydroxybutyryl-CoA dehydrogenase